MRIEHIAIWTADLERLRAFYEVHFGARAPAPKYVNATKKLETYFLELEGGARLELMHRPGLVAAAGSNVAGYAHIAISLGSRERVIDLTERLRAAGCPVVDGPRTTGDGYFESVVLDPDGNRLELTI